MESSNGRDKSKNSTMPDHYFDEDTRRGCVNIFSDSIYIDALQVSNEVI